MGKCARPRMRAGGGTCVGGPGLLCDDGVDCTIDSCQSPAGCMHGLDASRCDDHDICTSDSCDPVSGCTHIPVAEGGACDMWGANGPVSALALSGNTLYVGGSFPGVGPVTGSFAALDRGTGSPGSAFPKVDGEVFAVASDGAGGWFVGGRFTPVGIKRGTTWRTFSRMGELPRGTRNPTTGCIASRCVMASC